MANKAKTQPKQSTALEMRLDPLSTLFVQKLKSLKLGTN